FPVGYIGARESKDSMIRYLPKNIAYLSLTGRLGGSAYAAGAINAILVERAKLFSKEQQ
ncbi:MAG: precorrin-8X methylmutase, partial [Pseudomonadota bacterium]